jgi:hypothetical protein
MNEIKSSYSKKGSSLKKKGALDSSGKSLKTKRAHEKFEEKFGGDSKENNLPRLTTNQFIKRSSTGSEDLVNQDQDSLKKKVKVDDSS